MRGKTITIYLGRGRVGQTGKLFQYDRGQRLIIAGCDLPGTYQAHFSNEELGRSKPMIGDSTGVDIPDEYLQSGKDVHVWVYVVGEDHAETEYHGVIHVTPRALPTDITPTPAQQTAIDQLVEDLNDAISATEAVAEGIPGAIDDALTAAKASGEFDGPPGPEGPEGPAGKDGSPGKDGQDGYTPVKGVDYFDGQDGKDGKDGQDGSPGADGYSPTATVTKSGKVATITITDKNGTTSETVSDGADADPTTLIDDTAGSGTTNKTWSADKTLSTLNDKYEKPSTGIPASDLASGVIPTVPVTDVQVNGTSVLSNGTANIPLAGTSNPGVVKVSSSYGTFMDGTILGISKATSDNVKGGTQQSKPIVPYNQHESVFYGLAKASGDSTQSSSSNAVGVYTESALSAISGMLNAPVSVSGSTPSITAKSGVRYVCGEVSTLTIVVPASGCIDVVFESGSTATVLTVTPPSGVTAVKWYGGFDPSSLEANTTYEISILDGELGACLKWT